MQLIENAGQWYKMFSVQFMALAAALQAAWPMIPENIKASFPPSVVHWVSVALLVAGIFGRLVQQPSLASEDPPKV
jgi:hypothetical protein